MTPESPIRVAVIGYGLSGRVFHCPFIGAVPGLELSAVMQRTGDTAAETYPTARILRTPEQVFADPAIDLVVIATPNDTHEDLALAALAAGKHVVVDKPVAPTGAAVRNLIDAARTADKLLFPFHNRRWDGDFLTLQAILNEGKLGRVAKAISTWDRFRPGQKAGSWKEAAGDSHGLLQDLGPHLLDQAIALFGLPQRLTASVRRERDSTAIEDAFDITLEFDHPATGSPGSSNPQIAQTRQSQPTPLTAAHPILYECHATMIAADPAPRFRVHGASGSFTKSGLDPQEAHLTADGRHPPTLGSSIPWLAEPESEWGILTFAADPLTKPNVLTRTAVPTMDGDYRLFYANVRDAILGLTKQAVSGIDAWRVARLIELARQSSRERRSVNIDLTF